MAALNCSGSVVRPRTSTNLRSSARRRRAVPDDFGRGPASASLDRVMSAELFQRRARGVVDDEIVVLRLGAERCWSAAWPAGRKALAHAVKKKSWHRASESEGGYTSRTRSLRC